MPIYWNINSYIPLYLLVYLLILACKPTFIFNEHAYSTYLPQYIHVCLLLVKAPAAQLTIYTIRNLRVAVSKL